MSAINWTDPIVLASLFGAGGVIFGAVITGVFNLRTNRRKRAQGCNAAANEQAVRREPNSASSASEQDTDATSSATSSPQVLSFSAQNIIILDDRAVRAMRERGLNEILDIMNGKRNDTNTAAEQRENGGDKGSAL